MLSVAEARERILKNISPVTTENIPLQESLGRILAEPVSAGFDLPSFDNSSVDGFAVRSHDLHGSKPDQPTLLKVTGDIPAGSKSTGAIGAGEAMRIMTGAPLPAGADAIVMVEDSNFNFRDTGVITPEDVLIFKQASIGENIRKQGADVRSGQVVVNAPSLLRAQDIGLLALLGIANVEVFRKPRVAVISTGDELIPLTESMTPGKIHDSNSFSLSALAKDIGAEAVNLGIAPDDPQQIKKLLDSAVDENVDLIISSAGVSVGAFDYVKSVVESQGKVDFWKVNMRPGKPLAFGHYHGIPFFGLPGNPVSAFTGFLVFIRPALEKLSGLDPRQWKAKKAKLAELIESDGRESYLRAVVTEEGNELVARLTGHQASSNLLSLVQANALLIIPSGVKSVPPGEKVDAWLL